MYNRKYEEIRGKYEEICRKYVESLWDFKKLQALLLYIGSGTLKIPDSPPPGNTAFWRSTERGKVRGVTILTVFLI